VDRRPEILDINPKNWLKPYQKNTVWYMLKMGLFYHIIGLILMYLGSSLVTSVISDYTAPQIPVSISLAITAGFFEEAVFFGIPFYLSGNPLIQELFGLQLICLTLEWYPLRHWHMEDFCFRFPTFFLV
jgi:hypothetical protein